MQAIPVTPFIALRFRYTTEERLSLSLLPSLNFLALDELADGFEYELLE